MGHKNYYKTLGVEQKASAKEIKSAYRQLARKYHPDVSKESNAEERFKSINEAYDVLGDDKKKKSYDEQLSYASSHSSSHSGSNQDGAFNPPPGWQPGNFDANFFEEIIRKDRRRKSAEQHGNSDFFDSIFNSKKNTSYTNSANSNPQVATIPLSLEDIFSGATRKIRLPDGRNIQVKIPIGITEGQKIRIPNGPGRSELHLKVKLKPHRHFKLDGKNILLELPIAPWEAALGSLITVPTLEGNVNLRIPEGVQTGKKMRLQGRGLPGDPAGDQLITLVIMTPPATKDTERNLYREMETEFAWDPRSGML
ncbi:MAG: DnaJ C-terminal domain-containing protein [Thiotrichaceae bacterium]